MNYQVTKDHRVFLAGCYKNADVVKWADTRDLGFRAARRGGSSPSIRTKFTGERHERRLERLITILFKVR